MLLVVEFSPVQRRVVEGLEKDPDSSKSVITTVQHERLPKSIMGDPGAFPGYAIIPAFSGYAAWSPFSWMCSGNH